MLHPDFPPRYIPVPCAYGYIVFALRIFNCLCTLNLQLFHYLSCSSVLKHVIFMSLGGCVIFMIVISYLRICTLQNIKWIAIFYSLLPTVEDEFFQYKLVYKVQSIDADSFSTWGVPLCYYNIYEFFINPQFTVLYYILSYLLCVWFDLVISLTLTNHICSFTLFTLL